MSINQESLITDRPPRGRRRLLLGCGITLAVLLVLAGVAWWIISRHLGDMLSGVVREQADQAINGRLEFSRLEVDLAGRAVLTDAAIYPAGGDEPWIACPRTVVGFDLFNLIGPNRGKKAVTVTLHEPRIKLEREPDGGFNLERLVKQREQESEPIGLALNLRDAEIDFSDWCLLDQAYPRLDAGAGLGAQLLSELGYDSRGGAEVAVHRETLEVSGSVALNQQRSELSFNAHIEREGSGGTFTAKGTATLDGATFDVNLTADDTDLATAPSYLHALFPRLALAVADELEKTLQTSPLLAGGIGEAQLHLQKQHGESVKVKGEVNFEQLRFASSSLPQLYWPRLNLAYDSASGRLDSDQELQALGCVLSGKLAVNTSKDTLSGKLAVSCPELSATASQLHVGDLPLSGALNAQVALGGTPEDPQVSAELSSGIIKYKELKLGRLSGTAQLAGSQLTLAGVKLSGGDAPLTASGHYDMETGGGSFETRAGPLPLIQALDLARRVKPDAALPKLDAAGSLSAAATFTISAGKTKVALRAWSDSLTIAGQRFDAVDVKGELAPPNVNIEEAVAQYVSDTAFQLASFSSDGPLKIKLRASGSVSTLPGLKQPAVAIVGEGDTVNLAPNQAHISFKAIGPADDPEIRLQVKTTHATEPLVLHAQGHYRKGYAPATASLSWHQTSAAFDGRVDLGNQLIDGQVQADNVDLRRFSGSDRVSGGLSLAGTVGGSFSKPSLKGSLNMPHLALATDWRTYSAQDMSAEFELVEGNAISVSQGSFDFEGNHFTASGKLGQKGSRLNVNCTNFNLFSVLAMVQSPAPSTGSKTAPNRPPLEIESSGPLNIILTGDLSDPQATVQYTSSAGQVEGHRFSSAVLTANATRERAEVTKFNIAGDAGSLSLTGDLTYQPLSYSADATVSGFDVGILTPLIDNRLVGSLDGTLQGRAQLSGGRDSYRADGNLTLRDGEYNGMKISEARASFNSRDNTTHISEGVIVADGRVSLTGEVHYQPLSYALAAQFQDFNISAFTPMVDNELFADAGGRLDGTLAVAGGGGKYNVNGDLELSDGRFQGVAVNVARASIQSQGGVTHITNAEVLAEGTRLTGEAHIGPELADSRLTLGPDSRLALALITPLLPEGVPALTGRLAITKLELKPGRGRFPDLELVARSVDGPISAGEIRFDSIDASASIANDNLRLQRCELKAGQSSLYLTAQLNLGVFDQQPDERALPLDVTIGSRDFDLDDVAALLPPAQRQLIPGGVFTCEDVKLSGTNRHPQLSGRITFNITRLPAVSPFLALISRAQGSIEFTPGEFGVSADEFDIRRLELTPAGGGVAGSAVVKGSGTFQLYPFALESGSIDAILAEQNQYIFVNTNAIDPSLLGVEGGAQAQLPLNFEGWVGGTIHVAAPSSAAADQRMVIGGKLVINTEGHTSQIEMIRPKGKEKESTPAMFRFDEEQGLKIVINSGTEFLFDRGSDPANLDLRAELITPPVDSSIEDPEKRNELASITLRGIPGLLDKNNEDSFRIGGDVLLRSGSLRIYRHVVRLDSSTIDNKLHFSNEEGDIYPYLYVTSTLVLPRVLTGNETYTSTATDLGGTGSARGNRDLTVFITLSNYRLGPTVYTCTDHPWIEKDEQGECPATVVTKSGQSEPCGKELQPKGLDEAVNLRSEPSMSEEKILTYMFGQAASVLTGSGDLSQFAQEELQAFGASFISRYIEDQLDLAAFRVGGTGSEDNPYFMDLEKEVTPGFSVTYYRDFFSQSYQSEEYGVKYRILDQISGDRYNNVDLEVNFTQGGFRGTGSEFMFTWNTRF